MQAGESSVRYRTSVAALTSLDGDGLAPDDGGGVYVHEDPRTSVRLSVIDDELQVRDESLDLEKAKKNKLMGNILKGLLIAVTIAIYTGGPMLNSWATRIAGMQWNFQPSQDGDTNTDLMDFDTT